MSRTSFPTSELAFYRTLKRGYLDPFDITFTRIENKVAKGTPDLALELPERTLWMELKYNMEDLHSISNRRVLKPTAEFKIEQRKFLHERPGRGCLLWGFKYNFLLISGNYSVVGHCSRAKLLEDTENVEIFDVSYDWQKFSLSLHRLWERKCKEN